MPLYREYPPHPALATYVQCYWSIASSSRELINHVLPDGCVDVIFTMTEAECVAEVVGTMQSAIHSPVNAMTTFVGVRFKPGGALPFLRLPMHELTDSFLNLNDLWDGVGDHLAEKIHTAPTIAAKVTQLENALLQEVICVPDIDLLTLDALHTIQRAKGHISVHTLTAQLALSERQLERRFSQHTGLSPKMFARLIRFRTAAMLLQQQPTRPLQDLVHEIGFYDQAHFIHDFKAFSGLTPTEYLAQQRNVGFLQYTLRLL
jgi:AraC-like DNA-binding protein